MADEFLAPGRTLARRARRVTRLTLLAAGVLLVLPNKGVAACHMASFDQANVEVAEGQEVRLTVVLVGELPMCGGKIRYQTVDGTAKAPQDYSKRSGELTFVANNPNDRRQEIRIPTINDSGDEPQETFTVRLSDVDPNDDISPDGTPATVRINDNDAAPPPPAPGPTATKSQGGGNPPAGSPSPTNTPATTSPTATTTPTESKTPTLTPTPTDTVTGIAEPQGARGNGGLIAAVAAAVVILGGAGLLLIRRMRGS